jgi:outer membrane protein insertion porin family
VAVTQQVKRAADGTVDVVFVVDEGPHVVVSKIDFVGTHALDRAALLDILTKNGGTSIGGRYSREGLQDGLLHVQAQYYDIGYILSTIDEPVEKVSTDKSNIEITVKVTEGNQFRIGKLEVRGALVAPAADYLKALGLKKGDVFSRKRVGEGIQRIVEMHKTKGKGEPQVSPVTNVDPKDKRVDLAFEIGGGAAGAAGGGGS